MKSAALLSIICLSFLFSFCSTANAEPNLISWWKFDDGSGITAHDSAGSNDGTLENGPPTWTTGIINGALYFDDTNSDYVSVPDSNSLDFSTEDLTVSLWINLADLGDGGIVGKYDNWGEYNYAVWYEGEILHFEVGYPGETKDDPAQFETVTWSAAVNIANQWYHIVGTYDHNFVRLYINGQEADNESETRNLGEGTTPLCIGTVRYDGTSINVFNETNEYFHGLIDDVRIYNRALSVEEIEELYQQGFSGAFNPRPVDGAIGVDPNTLLSWSPRKDAASHDVYLGTDYNDVNDADIDSPEYMGNFDVNSYDPCGLEIDTIYFWRIDEFNEPNLWKGNVWSFDTSICIVPDVTNMTPDDAKAAIEAAGLVCDGNTCTTSAPGVGDGNVASTVPTAGTPVAPGTSVTKVILECYCGMTDYAEWEQVEKPICWCYPRQCHGDADGQKQGNAFIGYTYVDQLDLDLLALGWKVKEPTKGPGILNLQINGVPVACADFDHHRHGAISLGLTRIDQPDLDRMSFYWKVKEPSKGPGTPADCTPGNRTP
jgi:hypothetical protein